MGSEASQASPNSAGGPRASPSSLWGPARGHAHLEAQGPGQGMLCGPDVRLSTHRKGPRAQLGRAPSS